MPPKSPEHQALGNAIRTLRRAQGLSQERLALEAGLDRAYVGTIERGQRNATYGTLLKLAATLGVPLSEVINLAENH